MSNNDVKVDPGFLHLVEELKEKIFPELKICFSRTTISNNDFEGWYTALSKTKSILAKSSTYSETSINFLKSEEGELFGKTLQLYAGYGMCQIEKKSCAVLCDVLDNITTSKEQTDFLNQLCFGKIPDHLRALKYEQLPELPDEVKLAKIDGNSIVVVVGCGSLPLSGIAYALKGAKVIMIDRDPTAIEKFTPLLNKLPLTIREKLYLNISDGANFNFANSGATHVLIAGLADSKSEIINKIELSTEGSSSPLILVRTPQINLYQAIYPDIQNHEIFKRYTILGRVNTPDMTTYTYLIKLDQQTPNYQEKCLYPQKPSNA